MPTSSDASPPLAPRVLLAALLDLLLPGSCGGCAAPGPGWCAGCAARLGPLRWPVLPGGPPVVAAGRYRGPLRTAVLAYKERGRRDLAGPLAALLVARARTGRGRGAGDGWCPRPPGRRRRAPAAVTTCSGWPALARGRRRAAGGAGAAARSSGARLGRAGRRGARREPRRAAPRGRAGIPPALRRWSSSTTSSRPGRRCVPAGPPSWARSATLRRRSSWPMRPHRQHHEIPDLGAGINYVLSHLHRSGSLELQICCRTVISDTVGGAPSGTRTGLPGGTTVGCSPKSSSRRVRPPIPAP